MYANFSTALRKCDVREAKNFGRYYIVGRVPATCCNEHGRSKSYATEDEAIGAIMADPWIMATPGQVIQRADCSIFNREEF